MTLAVDLGALTVKTATDNQVASLPAPTGGPRAGLRAAIAAARPRDGICLAVPDAWLTGNVAGASLQETVRHECEDVAGVGPVTWVGQLAAVAALTASQHGPGRYLVCDLGGVGVRAGTFRVANGNVEIVATHSADGGGWRDFDIAIRSQAGPGLPPAWYEQALNQERRASRVFTDAAASAEEFGDTRVYLISATIGQIELAAGQVIDGFAPTLRQLRSAIEAVIRTGSPDHVALTGGLGWLPLAARAIADAVGAAPVAAGLGAAARGALLFAHGEARLLPPTGRQEITVPAHRILNGLLEGFSVTLPWTEPFAPLPGGAMAIDKDELEVTIAGKPRLVRLDGMAPGTYRIGVRDAWPGPGVLVVRPIAGENAHVVSLATLANS
jgi:hypothetical protein